MKIGERGQVTIPRQFRERFDLLPSTQVDFVELEGQLFLRKKLSRPPSNFRKWVGYLKGKPRNVDQFMEAIRGR
ncbi:MAG: AbrB/MazE/SpoVT family DNA-binding domain-containing protein [Verrucomicrobia bacterium]|nr:AbrB/MazE/SpoVT family DNA-binding domain-containing protein [Verrucomicrobiota bacterium]